MPMTIKLNGIGYINWEQASVFRSMETVCGAFSFTSSADENNLFPIKVGEAVEISVDGIQVINGFVEKLGIEYSAKSHAITVSGRDILGDLVDSTVGAIKEFTGAVSLLDIARRVLDENNLSSVNIKDETGGFETFKPIEVTSAEVGMGAFEFLELYARKSQILLTNDGKGNLVFARASTEALPATLKNKVGGDSNILQASTNFDDSQRHYKYIVQSQLNAQSQDLGVSPKDIASQRGQAIDSQIRTSRLLEFNAEESSDSQTATERAVWEANIRRARSLSYSPTIQGHSVNGQLWKPNILVEVDDDFADIQATLLIKSVRYAQSIDGGSTTKLGLTYQDAYTLQAEQSAREAIGKGLTKE